MVEDNYIIEIISVDVLDNYIIKKNYFILSLYDGISKGKLFNSKLEIEIYDDDIKIKRGYELKIILDDMVYMTNFDTRYMNIDIKNLDTIYGIKGIQMTENDLVEKLLNTFGDPSYALYNSVLLLAKMLCRSGVISNIKKLSERSKSIIKSSINGDNNIFFHASLKESIDECNDLYSRILTATYPNKGTKYFKMFIDPNRYDVITRRKKQTKEKKNRIEKVVYHSSL